MRWYCVPPTQRVLEALFMVHKDVPQLFFKFRALKAASDQLSLKAWRELGLWRKLCNAGVCQWSAVAACHLYGNARAFAIRSITKGHLATYCHNGISSKKKEQTMTNDIVREFVHGWSPQWSAYFSFLLKPEQNVGYTCGHKLFFCWYFENQRAIKTINHYCQFMWEINLFISISCEPFKEF